MAKSGFSVKKVPVILVEASSIKDAKMRVLQSVSQYGHVTNQGLFEFTGDMDLAKMAENFDIPNIDFDKLSASFSEEPVATDDAAKPTEIETGEFSKMVHTCPKCGFQFGAE